MQPRWVPDDRTSAESIRQIRLGRVSGSERKRMAPIDAEFGDYMLATTTSYTCSCIHGTATPAALSERPTPTTPLPTGPHNQGIHRDAGGAKLLVRPRLSGAGPATRQPIQRVMAIGESFSTSNQPELFQRRVRGWAARRRATGPTATISICATRQSATRVELHFTRNQTWTADGATLNPVFLMTYSCSTASHGSLTTEDSVTLRIYGVIVSAAVLSLAASVRAQVSPISARHGHHARAERTSRGPRSCRCRIS